MTDPYDPYRQNNPYGPPGQPFGPYQGQPAYQGGQQPDATRQFGPYDPYGPPPQQYQGSYGQPAGWGPGGPAAPAPPGGPGGFPPPPPKASRGPLIAGAVLGAILLLGSIVVVAIALGGDDQQAGSGVAPATTRPATTSRPPTTTPDEDFQAGQCATLTPEDNGRATIRIAECGGVLSDVVIAKVQGARCEQPFLSFDPGKGEVYCLAMDAREGDCFRLDQLIKRALSCAGTETRKVAKIFDGVADRSRCDAVPGTVDAYAYKDPSKTICLSNAE